MRKFDGGWQVGLKTYRNPQTGGLTRLLAWHQDQVLSAPDDALLLATAPECRFAALQWGDTLRTYQAHPEFTPDYLMGLFEVRGAALDPEVVRAGRESLTEAVPDDISGEIAEFLVAAATQRDARA